MIAIEKSTVRLTLSIECQDDLRERGEWLLDVVAAFEKTPTGLANGTTVQVGWSMLTLVARADGVLEVREPAFDANPFVSTRTDVSTTLRVLSAQTDLLRRVGSEGLTARFDDKVIVQKGCLAEPAIYAQRSEPVAGDSGWYVGLLDGPPATDPENLEALRLFQLLAIRPSLLAAMALPVGWLSVWQGDELRGIADAQNEERWTVR
jgi:hypothetical protein